MISALNSHRIEQATLSRILDQAVEDMQRQGAVAIAHAALVRALDAERLRLGSEWPRAIEVCRAHPLYGILGNDPLIQRTRAKPRGYAGDAVTLDLLYSGLSENERTSTSAHARELFEANFSAAPPRSVRLRRERLAREIDATADRRARPRILSVACGHLREVASSTAFLDRRIGMLSALDQDRESLAVIEAELGHVPELELIHGSVRDLLKGTITLAGYDLIYTAGLYDYLPHPVAAGLTTVLASALAPGGKLLIGNFATDYSGIAFIEAFMDWTLICRSEEELRSLCVRVPRDEIRAIETYLDETGCVAYLELTKL